MGTRASHIAHAMKLRARAFECRRLAELVTDKVLSPQYLGLAQSYERLADTEETLAQMEITPLPDQLPAGRDESVPRKGE